LSGTEIGRDYGRASSNKNKINTVPYDPRRDAEDSDGTSDTVTDTVRSYSQSQEARWEF
jgi:hypothetical protein